MRENKYDQSERIIRKMIEEKNPDMDWAYSLWGRIYQMKTPVDFDKSQACFDKALEINPKFFNAAMAAGWLQFSKKDYEKAIEFFNKAHHLKPSHFGTVNGLALSNRRLGNHEAAVKAYKLNIEKHPDKLWSYGNYSDYKMNVEKDTIGASNLFREASKNLDESGDYYVTLSGMYFFQNKMDSAWMYMEKALDYDPYNVNALNQIARYHTYHTQDYATADHFYRRLYEARKVKDIESSIVASTLNVWAMNDYMSGNLDSAFVHVRKAIKVFPSNEYPYTTLAETFHYAGMVDSFFHYSKIAYDLGYDFNEAMDDEPYINYKNDPRFKLLLVPKIKN